MAKAKEDNGNHVMYIVHPAFSKVLVDTSTGEMLVTMSHEQVWVTADIMRRIKRFLLQYVPDEILGITALWVDSVMGVMEDASRQPPALGVKRFKYPYEDGGVLDGLESREDAIITTMLNNMPGVHIICNEIGHILYSSDKDFLGYGPRELVGHSVLEVIVPEHRDRLLRTMVNNAKGVYRPASYIVVDAEGHRQWITVMHRPCNVNGGSVLVTLLRGRLISKEKRIDRDARPS